MIRSNRRSIALLVFIILTLSGFSSADVRLPSVIGDNMVLQQGMEVPIWGWADPCEQVTVTANWGSEKWEATAGQDGRWLVKIQPPRLLVEDKSGGGPYEMNISGKNTLSLKNILVGEVWVCSGQSNMEWPLSRADNAGQEVNEANYPQIRLFTVGRKVSYTPMKNCRGSWKVCNPQSAVAFSAVGYFFGRELHKELNVPIGLIKAAVGGTPVESWMSREYLEADADFQPILRRYEETAAHFPELYRKYQLEKKNYQRMAGQMKREGKPVPQRPDFQEPIGPNHPYSPTGLYNGMIIPIIPKGIRGVIWYQGESNAGRAEQYRTLFPAMIKNWREKWGHGDFPFLYVQLANWQQAEPLPKENDWAELREAQLMTLSVPNTGMAVAIDIGDANSIHPTNKQDVGKRLALWALAKTYNKDVVYSGPLYKYMGVEGNKAILHFDHVNGGLIVKGGEQLKGFAIAGQDKKFLWADAKVEGDTVVVSSDKVVEPVAVRYGWAINPVCNLYNKAGLPASPFRTDDWPGLTDKQR
ncbi:MAG: hypothetical protein JW749_05395 [Sedimentisphaerales bacterium]|nr:hypothetical protein [Sedimentisphaerales bacterium]